MRSTLVAWQQRGWMAAVGHERIPLAFGASPYLNFLDLLRAGYADYTINDAALEYMREHVLAGTLVPLRAMCGHRVIATAG